MNSSPESTGFLINGTLNIRGRLIDLSTPRVMGILNVTPDSFYDGSRTPDEKSILEKAGAMLEAGATFIDVGGYSTRPGADDVPENEELKRVIGAIRALKGSFPEAIISIDTFRSVIARAAVSEGADMINDVSGGDMDPEMFSTVAQLGVPYILMHMRGTPATMSSLNKYENLIVDVQRELKGKLHQLTSLGVRDVIVDPGFGFAKNVSQNFELLDKLDLFRQLERPLLVGLSRKSMIWKTLKTTPEHALNGSTALHTVALMKGASVLRVHDVKEAMECITLTRELTTRRQLFSISNAGK